MRSTIKMTLSAVLAVFALGVLTSASASAAECPGTGTGVALCSGGHALEGTFAFGGKGPGTEELWTQGWSLPRCDTSTSKGQFVTTNSKVEVTGLVIEWSNCRVIGSPPGCSVKPIIWDGANGTGSGSGLKGVLTGTGEITLSPMIGVKLTAIHVEGASCETANEYKITGKEKCKLPSSTSEAATHVVQCQATGSEVKWGAKPVRLAFEETIGLSPSKEFSLKQS